MQWLSAMQESHPLSPGGAPHYTLDMHYIIGQIIQIESLFRFWCVALFFGFFNLI